MLKHIQVTLHLRGVLRLVPGMSQVPKPNTIPQFISKKEEMLMNKEMQNNEARVVYHLIIVQKYNLYNTVLLELGKSLQNQVHFFFFIFQAGIWAKDLQEIGNNYTTSWWQIQYWNPRH